MKRIILTLGILFSVLVLNAQTRIDFDYTKSFNVSSLWIDYNQNEEPELDEFFKVSKGMECTITIDYKDFDTAGNLLKMIMPVVNGVTNKSKTFRANLEDVMLFKTSSGYFVANKLKEKLFGIAKDDDGRYAVMIFNPAIMR